MIEFQLNDYGSRLRVTLIDGETELPIDVSAATLVQYVFSRPDNSTFIKTGGFDSNGSDGKVVYLLANGDLNMVGRWSYQVYVTFTGELLHSAVGKFKVLNNLY